MRRNESERKKKRDLNFCHVYDARHFFMLVAGANGNGLRRYSRTQWTWHAKYYL